MNVFKKHSAYKGSNLAPQISELNKAMGELHAIKLASATTGPDFIALKSNLLNALSTCSEDWNLEREKKKEQCGAILRGVNGEYRRIAKGGNGGASWRPGEDQELAAVLKVSLEPDGLLSPSHMVVLEVKDEMHKAKSTI